MRFISLAVLALLSSTAVASAGSPPDVRAGHWAAGYVQEMLANRVMSLPDGRNFRGEAPVSRAEAVTIIAGVARKLEAGSWRARPSSSVTIRAISAKAGSPAADHAPVTRYTVAAVLARVADYFSNGIMRPTAGSTDTSKSTALPDKAKLTLAPTNRSYSDLKYLVDRKLVWPGSALLKPDSKPLTANELRQGVDELVVGMNDRLTELGHDAEGSTRDATLRARDKLRHKPHP